ncbi:MAG TPA: hypothetical protein GXZ59_02635 [Clostridiaceae bacterium]|nr:hypothetical protein [Clostridiaceae bacterium]
MNNHDQLTAILHHSIKLQPRQQLIDLIKLIYQSEFGTGHLITEESSSLERLKDEIHAHRNEPEPVTGRFTPLGNGLCRIHLAGIENTGISASTVNRLCIWAASLVKGQGLQFKEKLLGLRACLEATACQSGLIELDRFLDAYDFETCPSFSHSTQYHEYYAPSYRVVTLDLWLYFDLFTRLDRLLQSESSVNLAIDGLCGAGKSTLAQLLQFIYSAQYSAQVIPMDHFFLPSRLRTAERLQEPGGNIDYERFLAEVAYPLSESKQFSYHVFSCQNTSHNRKVTIKPGKLNIVEGSYSLHPRLRSLYNLKVFLTVDRDEQLRRLKNRSSEEQFFDFTEKWIPLENFYFDQLKIPQHSDLVLRSDRD